MAKPIKRDAIQTVGEIGAGTLRGGIGGIGIMALGVLAVAAIGAGLAALAVVAVPTILAGVAGAAGWAVGVSSSGAAMSAMAGFMTSYTIGGVVTGIAATAGALVGGGAAVAGISSVGAPGIGAFLGANALIGMFRSAGKVGRENAAYSAKMNNKLMGREAEMAAVHNNAVQMTQQAMAPQIQQYGEQMKQEGAQMVLAKLQEHAAEEKTKSFVATEDQRRAQTAAATPHVG